MLSSFVGEGDIRYLAVKDQTVPVGMRLLLAVAAGEPITLFQTRIRDLGTGRQKRASGLVTRYPASSIRFFCTAAVTLSVPTHCRSEVPPKTLAPNGCWSPRLQRPRVC